MLLLEKSLYTSVRQQVLQHSCAWFVCVVGLCGCSMYESVSERKKHKRKATITAGNYLIRFHNQQLTKLPLFIVLLCRIYLCSVCAHTNNVYVLYLKELVSVA